VFGRNTGELAVYIRNGISNRFTEIRKMKEIIWMGVRCNAISHVGLIINIF
jgi:hypothetical protein